MTNEIKEMLDYLKDDSKSFVICGVSYYKISDYKTKVLLDYITNLQHRINKAIEYIENLQQSNEELQRDYNKSIDFGIYETDNLLSILKGNTNE